MPIKHLLAKLALFLYILIGLLVYKDYGVSWDEEFQHDYGRVVYEYVFEGNQELHEHNSRYHGPVFQFLLYAAEHVSGISHNKRIFELRHLLTFLVSVIGCWIFYRLLLHFKFSPYWSTLGMIFLICSPRIFAHSFFNSKDAVFMYVFIIGVYAMMRFLTNPNCRTALVHGLICGILIDIRILGVFVPMMTLILFLLQNHRNQSITIRSLWPVVPYGIITMAAVFICWPTLWHAPIEEFNNALAKMSAYPWDDPILFDGSFQLPADLPWYYLPKWMLVSTPIFLPALIIIGLLSWFLNHRISVSDKLVPFLWVLLPFGLILWKGATVYDGWRHVFFLYPAFLILAIYGAQKLFNDWLKFKFSRFVPLVLVLLPLSFIVQAHPFQQVYFNSIVMPNAWKNYEMDYWGLSYKQAFEWLVENSDDEILKVSVANSPGYFNHWMLPEIDRSRIEYVSRDSATFFISNFRFPDEHDAFINEADDYTDSVKIITVNGNPVVGVFQLSPS